MLDPKKTMENFEALDSEIARLRAENARLREALREVEMHSLIRELRHSRLESVCLFCGIAQFLDEVKHSSGCPMDAVNRALTETEAS